jgi:leucyl-tRNA synthetase
MLSDSPPERDVIWTEEGAQGASSFVQRLWRLVGELASVAAPVGTPKPDSFSEPAQALRKAVHGAILKVEENIERLRFNVCIAKLYELANSLSSAIGAVHSRDIAPDMRFAFREAAETLVLLFAPFMPHLAEECWALLGHDSAVFETPWPQADRALVVDETITLPVQVNGRKRGDLVIDRNADQRAIEAAVVALEPVQRALEGRVPKKIIIVPQRIVNIVA